MKNLAIFLLSASCLLAQTYVQGSPNAAPFQGCRSGTPNTCAMAGNTTTGNAVIIGVTLEDLTSTVTSITDATGVNTYAAASAILRAPIEGMSHQIWYACGITGGFTSVVVTATGGSTVTITPVEYSGLAGSLCLDVGTSGTCPAFSCATSPSITTASANTLIVTFLANSSGASPNAPYTGRQQYSPNSSQSLGDRIAATATSYVTGWTGGYGVVAASFKTPAVVTSVRSFTVTRR